MAGQLEYRFAGRIILVASSKTFSSPPSDSLIPSRLDSNHLYPPIAAGRVSPQSHPVVISIAETIIIVILGTAAQGNVLRNDARRTRHDMTETPGNLGVKHDVYLAKGLATYTSSKQASRSLYFSRKSRKRHYHAKRVSEPPHPTR